MSDRLWEYRGYWIRKLGHSPNFYACWYDQRRGREAHRTLATKILDEAKDRLVKLVGSATADGSRSPDRVMMLAALDHYYENDVKEKPSGGQAMRAIAIVTEFLGERIVPAAPVSTFGPLRQREFMSWSREKFAHSPSTIARNLSVVSSAFRYGMKLKIVEDGLGNKHEVQLLESAPDVVTQAGRVAEVLALPEPMPREWVPTYQQFGRFIDAIDKRQENLFRFVVLALNTWARPEALLDLRVSTQVKFAQGLVDLNPPGRRQNKKYRPRIALTGNLAGWLELWDCDSPLEWNGGSIGVIKKTFKRHALDCGLAEFTQGTIRHFMATAVRRIKPPVSQEQRDVWLGHASKRTAKFYESVDPEYLKDCKIATEKVIRELQKHTKRQLFARKLRASEPLAGKPAKVQEAQHVGK